MPSGQKLNPCVQARLMLTESTAGNRIVIKQCCDSPLRDLSREFDKWNSVFQRYRRWGKAERFTRIFAEISGRQIGNMP